MAFKKVWHVSSLYTQQSRQLASWLKNSSCENGDRMYIIRQSFSLWKELKFGKSFALHLRFCVISISFTSFALLCFTQRRVCQISVFSRTKKLAYNILLQDAYLANAGSTQYRVYKEESLTRHQLRQLIHSAAMSACFMAEKPIM